MACDECQISLIDAVNLFQSREKSIEFLKKHKIIMQEVKCSSCGNPAVLSKNNLQWRCQRRHTERAGKKVISRRCNFKQSIRSETWLENAHLTPEKCCMFMALYILGNPPHQDFLCETMKLSSTTVCDWSSFIRETLIYWGFASSSEKLGGPGKVVEIDEAKFGKRKYNRGRVIHGQWLFGGFERNSKKIFLEAVENRNSSTLLEIIKRKIEVGTTIISDCWKAYDCLREEGMI